MMPDDLITFLRARLDEDEAAAKHTDQIGYPDVGLSLAQSAHIARHNPARVLREVEAKRRMLEDLDLTYPDEEHLCKLLAAVYSDHPDYRQEWRP